MEIQNGGQLVVRESQMAVFANEGKLANVFGPGTHRLTTQTLPVLTYQKNWDKLFESPFKSDMYFFNRAGAQRARHQHLLHARCPGLHRLPGSRLKDQPRPTGWAYFSVQFFVTWRSKRSRS